MQRTICNLFYGLLTLLIASGSSVEADARQDKNRIEYWRANYQELKPADDPRVVRARTIFQRLTQVAGRRPDVQPKLFMIKNDPWHLTLPIALPQGWIVLSQGVLEMCYQEPTRGDDRLAFILAHELSHQLNGDLWHLRFFQAVEAAPNQQPVASPVDTEVRRAASRTEHVLTRELQADERGIIYAAMAGFDPHAIVTADDRVNFFADWVRALHPDRIGGLSPEQLHPTPQERAEALKTHLHQVVNQTAAFQAGLWWYYAGDYPQAIQAFDHFRGLFPGREVIHNLAASHHRLALQLHQAWKPDKPTVPFQISMAIAPETRASEMYLDNRTRASRGKVASADAAILFREHLDHAIRLYREVLQLDASYASSARNLGSALIVRAVHSTGVDRQADLAETVMTLSRALRYQPTDVAILTNLGVALFYEGQFDRAKTSLHQAWTLAPAYAAPVYNLGHIAQMEQREAETQRYRRQYQRLGNSHAKSQPATRNAFTEHVQELVIGAIIPSQRQKRQPRTFRLSGNTYTLATYAPGVMTLTQDGEVLMAMAHQGYHRSSARGIRRGS
ncbi:MAG: hypothetical protein OEU26_27530, partial [Candidatus Tectomicrobia bacterium]|nr:hypothetical protein [Candidatus Tectomicrobia bacterium]